MKLLANSKRPLMVAAALAAIAALPLISRAQNVYTWSAPGTGSWHNGANWSGATVPVTGDIAAINNSGTAHVSGGYASAYLIGLGNIFVSGGANGNIRVDNGAQVNTFALSAGISTGTASATSVANIDGAATRWNTSYLTIGNYGNGIVNITNGAQMFVSTVAQVGAWGSGSSGINIIGPGSALDVDTYDALTVGNGGRGFLNVADGGTARLTALVLGRDAGGSGSAVVTGSNSSLVLRGNIIQIGFYSEPDKGGDLTIKDGGTVDIANGTGFVSVGSNSSGTLSIGDGGRAGTLLASSVNGSGNRAAVVFNHSDASYEFAPRLAGTLNVIQRGPGMTVLSGSNSHTGGTVVEAGAVGVSAVENLGTGAVSLANGGLKLLGAVDFESRAFALTGTGASFDTGGFNASVGGIISGAGVLNKRGEGLLVLTASNSYSGGTSVHDGTLQIGNGGATGSIAGNIVNDADLVFNRSNDFTFDGIISGLGDVTKAGSGMLTFSNFHTYEGATHVNAGTLSVLGGIGMGADLTVAGGAALTGTGVINRNVVVSSGGFLSASLTISGQLTMGGAYNAGNITSGQTLAVGSGSAATVGSATNGTIDAVHGTASVSALDGATVNSGNWGVTVGTMSSGTVHADSGGVNVAQLNGGVISVSNSASVIAQQGTFNGSITGEGTLIKTGSGTLALQSSNAYSGGTIVFGGMLLAVTEDSLGSAPVRIVNNGRFRASFSGEVANEIISESAAAAYEKVFSGAEDLAHFGQFSSGIGGEDTTAFFAAGSASAEGTDLNASYSFTNTSGMISDKLSINGLDGTTFLLVMNVDLSASFDINDIYIAWFDERSGSETSGTWVNAVAGNHGANNNQRFLGDLSYEEFLSGGWDPETMLGAYGVNMANGDVWAVIDHNSEFGVVPEPTTTVLLAAGVLLLFAKAVFRVRNAARDVAARNERFRKNKSPGVPPEIHSANL